MRHEPNRSQAISDTDQHHSLSSQDLSTVGRNGGGPGVEPATINPDKDRDMSRGGFRRRPDIQIEAVFAHCRSCLTRRRKTALYALRRKFVAFPPPFPTRRGLRSPPTQVADWRCCKGHAAIDGQSLFNGRSEERRVGKECRSRWSPY